MSVNRATFKTKTCLVIALSMSIMLTGCIIKKPLVSSNSQTPDLINTKADTKKDQVNSIDLPPKTKKAKKKSDNISIVVDDQESPEKVTAIELEKNPDSITNNIKIDEKQSVSATPIKSLDLKDKDMDKKNSKDMTDELNTEITSKVSKPELSFFELSGKLILLDKNGKTYNSENTFVVLEPLSSPTNLPKVMPKNHEVQMIKSNYVPSHLIISTNDTLEFINSDTYRHNVFSLSDANPFDLGTYGPGRRPPTPFEGEGIIKIYCNIHPNMAMFVQITKSRWHSLIKSDSSFKIIDIPMGTYKVKAWNIRGEYEGSITIKDNITNHTIEITVKTSTIEPHKNKFGKKYPRNLDEDESY